MVAPVAVVLLLHLRIHRIQEQQQRPPQGDGVVEGVLGLGVQQDGGYQRKAAPLTQPARLRRHSRFRPSAPCPAWVPDPFHRPVEKLVVG